MKISFTKTFYSFLFLPENMKLILSLGRKEGFYLNAWFFFFSKNYFTLDSEYFFSISVKSSSVFQ